MVRRCIGLAAILVLGWGSVALASAALAQDGQAPKHPAHKAHAKTVESSNPNDFSEDWSIAAPRSSGGSSAGVGEDPSVAAGRKKFFEQSTTMQGGGPTGSQSGSSSGFQPSMGLSF
ncbi:hypothetical protein [uncultured Methylovirgula sp.]|uniref:hypothetical protein n=1 Tax=uncultured Methylovirgula sp. TaxID=1285960 RepID=UPI00260233F1|nr:hypothetical protein [uncultured Methylovirgula sp.]